MDEQAPHSGTGSAADLAAAEPPRHRYEGVRAERDRVRKIHGEAGIPFYEVFVNTSLEECDRREPKGLYAKAEWAGSKTRPASVPSTRNRRIPTSKPRRTSRRLFARSSGCSARGSGHSLADRWETSIGVP
jgi:hypothetical protein